MVYRIYVEKKEGFRNEANALLAEVRGSLGISGIRGIRVLNRYDAENMDEELFVRSVSGVFSEPQVDDVYSELNSEPGDVVFAVEYLPGQFDQRADSASECIQLISKGERPLIHSAKVYILSGDLSDSDISAIKGHLINPVEAREASLELPETLVTEYGVPDDVEILEGFTDLDEEGLSEFLSGHGLAMDLADLTMCRDYFREKGREPSITEIRVIDTYWSDHCRHTTFNTTIDSVSFGSGKDASEIEVTYNEYLALRRELGREAKPVTLMDIGTIAAKALKSRGLLDKLDESEEINACTVKIDVEVDGEVQPWLLLFKNETHNHPTEIEPFGGAATCIGGAIRDPLSGRSYVYSAMRLTGAGDPLTPVSETIKGKLPQRTIVTTAAAGYSSYGNQIGLATGIVDELYHPGYVAKRMEVGAVIAAAPAENVRRERPSAGDVVLLLGGKTGRDGCGGATGSSKSHTTESLATCGAEVQKGNAPEERKLQRLFRNPEASKLIKRCNDFGAGGVSVAIGELADGLHIDLDKVPKKYEGLDGTELAISESQERMAVVVAPEDEERFIELSALENLSCTRVAEVTDDAVLTMEWRGKTIVEIERSFLDTNGAEKHIDIEIEEPAAAERTYKGNFAQRYREMAGSLDICSRRGLSERFDSTIGAGTVLMPFGGIYQRTPIQAMVNLISVEKGHTDDCSVMSWGFDPYVSSASPYHGAYTAVISSAAKLVAAGADLMDTYLSFQEYFPKPGRTPSRWGLPFAAVLGAFKAQMALSIGAIGGKDSMSGSFEDIDVPPTLVSFAVTTAKAEDILSPEFKGCGNDLILLAPEYDENGFPTGDIRGFYDSVSDLTAAGSVLSAYALGPGGIAEALMKMSFGNGIGVELDSSSPVSAPDELFAMRHGALLIEAAEDVSAKDIIAGFKARSSAWTAVKVGMTADVPIIKRGWEEVKISELSDIYESKLEPVYPCNIKTRPIDTRHLTFQGERLRSSSIHVAKPRVLIPVFPGTNCEYDSAKAFADAGAEPEIFVIRNTEPGDVARSVESFASRIKESQIIFIPGGFSGGDEPDGSGKFITAFFRNPEISAAVSELLDERDGLMAGICNGFQALIKLGLVPYGRIEDSDYSDPTLTFNEIGRHQSKLVRVRVASNKSPWLAETQVGDIYTVPISHGEGRFVASEEDIAMLAENGQIITQYVDLAGEPSGDIQFNPNGSFCAIEGITSPDGRVLGKMGHAERVGKNLYKNVPGEFDMGLFRSAVRYFKGI